MPWVMTNLQLSTLKGMGSRYVQARIEGKLDLFLLWAAQHVSTVYPPLVHPGVKALGLGPDAEQIKEHQARWRKV